MKQPKIVVWCPERAADPTVKQKTRTPCCWDWQQLPACACTPMINYLRDHSPHQEPRLHQLKYKKEQP